MGGSLTFRILSLGLLYFGYFNESFPFKVLPVYYNILFVIFTLPLLHFCVDNETLNLIFKFFNFVDQVVASTCYCETWWNRTMWFSFWYETTCTWLCRLLWERWYRPNRYPKYPSTANSNANCGNTRRCTTICCYWKTFTGYILFVIQANLVTAF